jgi:hypothetical protein
MNHIRVQDQYRTNELSKKPGGDEVTIYTKDGMVRTYDKVKNTQKYISSLAYKEEIVRIDINGEEKWTSNEPGVKYWEM